MTKEKTNQYKNGKWQEIDYFRLLMPEVPQDRLRKLLAKPEFEKTNEINLDDVDDLLLKLLKEEEEAKKRSQALSDEMSFDAFISFKSEDFEYANEVYRFLIDKNLRVFLSRISISELGRADFLKQIHFALDASNNMIVVGSKKEYLTARWVRYEWEAFINDLNSGLKKGNLITVLADRLPPNDLPMGLRNKEAIPLIEGELERLLDFIKVDSVL